MEWWPKMAKLGKEGNHAPQVFGCITGEIPDRRLAVFGKCQSSTCVRQKYQSVVWSFCSFQIMGMANSIAFLLFSEPAAEPKTETARSTYYVGSPILNLISNTAPRAGMECSFHLRCESFLLLLIDQLPTHDKNCQGGSNFSWSWWPLTMSMVVLNATSILFLFNKSQVWLSARFVDASESIIMSDLTPPTVTVVLSETWSTLRPGSHIEDHYLHLVHQPDHTSIASTFSIQHNGLCLHTCRSLL